MILCKFNVNKVRSVQTIHQIYTACTGHTQPNSLSPSIFLALTVSQSYTNYLAILKIEHNESKKKRSAREREREKEWNERRRKFIRVTMTTPLKGMKEKWNDDEKKKRRKKKKWFALCVTHMNGFLSMWISFYCYVLQIEVRKNAGRIEMEVRFAFCQLRTLLADCLYLFPTLCMMKSLLSVSNYIEHSQQHIQMRCICQWLPFRKWYENPFGVVAPLYLLRASCTRLLLTWMRFYFIDNSFWPSENGWISPDDTLLYKHQCTIRSIVAKYNLRAVNEIIGKSFVQSSIWQWYNTHTLTHT